MAYVAETGSRVSDEHVLGLDNREFDVLLATEKGFEELAVRQVLSSSTPRR